MKIKFLVGNTKVTNISSVPFGKKECKLLNDISLKLKLLKDINKYPDIKAAAFWCRRKNIENLKKNLIDKNLRLGIGKLLHVTPSNVPTNFFYSLMIGLLTGNSNIVKVPTKNFEQVKLICSVIKIAINENPFFKNRISIIQYDNNEIEITETLSKDCNGRLLWGSDRTIEDLKKIPSKTKSIDIIFPDRYSLALLNSQKINQLSENGIINLVKNFYNDTFFYDQNACTSPHLILWTGDTNTIKKAKKIFWLHLLKQVKSKFDLTNHITSEKLNHIYNLIAKHDNLGSLKNYENLIHVFDKTKLRYDNDNLRGKWGVFFENNISDLDKLNKYINEKYQTLSYFGFEKKYFENFIIKMKPLGIDRIVPVGRSMEMSFFWDGYDLKNTLTRTVEIK